MNQLVKKKDNGKFVINNPEFSVEWAEWKGDELHVDVYFYELNETIKSVFRYDQVYEYLSRPYTIDRECAGEHVQYEITPDEDDVYYDMHHYPSTVAFEMLCSGQEFDII